MLGGVSAACSTAKSMVVAVACKEISMAWLRVTNYYLGYSVVNKQFYFY